MNICLTRLVVFLIVIVCIVTSISHLHAQSGSINYDSLYQNYLNEDLSVKLRSESKAKIIERRYLFSNPDSAQILAKELYQFNTINEYHIGRAGSLTVLGIALSLQSEYENAEIYFDKALKILEQHIPKDPKHPDHKLILINTAAIYNNLATNKQEKGELYTALDYYNRCIKVYDALLQNNPNAKNRLYYVKLVLNKASILEILVEENELDKASVVKKEIDDLLKIIEVDGKKFPRPYVYNHIARFYEKMGEPQKAIRYLNEKIIESDDKNIVTPHVSSLAYNYIGTIYQNLNKLDSARIYLNGSLELSRKIKTPINIVKNLSGLVEINLAENKLSDASTMLLEAKELAIEKNLNVELSKVILLENKYNYQNEIARQEQDLKLQDQSLKLENQKFKNTRNLLIGTSLLVFFLSIFLFVYYRLNRKLKQFQNTLIQQKDELLQNNIEIKNSKEQIENQKEKMALLINHLQENEIIIESQNKSLKESNISLENFAYIAAHDLNAPIRTISSFVQLLFSRYQDRIDPKDRYMFDYITNDTKRLSTMVDGLLGLSQITKNLPARESIDLNELITVAFDQLASNIESQGAVIKKEINPLPTVFSYYPLLQALFLNLINNSIKFSNGFQNTITIDWKKRGDFLEFSVKDQGIGIPQLILPTIFDMFSKYNGVNDNRNIGNGIGLATCRKIVNFLGGEIKAEST